MKFLNKIAFAKYAICFRISNIELTVPAGMDYTPVQSNLYINYSFVNSSWIPQQNQVGFHLVCAIAMDNAG